MLLLCKHSMFITQLMLHRADRETVHIDGDRPTMTNSIVCTPWPNNHNAMTSWAIECQMIGMFDYNLQEYGHKQGM